MTGLQFPWYGRPDPGLWFGRLQSKADDVSQLGYGTGTAWYKSGDESKIDRNLVDAIKMAIDLGYYHLDCAESEFGICNSSGHAPWL